jgi:hypothetical protein
MQDGVNGNQFEHFIQCARGSEKHSSTLVARTAFRF